MKNPTVYLGDAVYAHHDGHHVILETHNGQSVDQRIYLEDAVITSLLNYLEATFDCRIKVEKNRTGDGDV